jgi:hypothetical protein
MFRGRLTFLISFVAALFCTRGWAEVRDSERFAELLLDNVQSRLVGETDPQRIARITEALILEMKGIHDSVSQPVNFGFTYRRDFARIFSPSVLPSLLKLPAPAIEVFLSHTDRQTVRRVRQNIPDSLSLPRRTAISQAEIKLALAAATEPGNKGSKIGALLGVTGGTGLVMGAPIVAPNSLLGGLIHDPIQRTAVAGAGLVIGGTIGAGVDRLISPLTKRWGRAALAEAVAVANDNQLPVTENLLSRAQSVLAPYAVCEEAEEQLEDSLPMHSGSQPQLASGH